MCLSFIIKDTHTSMCVSTGKICNLCQIQNEKEYTFVITRVKVVENKKAESAHSMITAY